MSLAVPSSASPPNLHLPPGSSLRLVDQDLLHIAERVAELSPRLHVWVIESGQGVEYAISEFCEDQTERLVFRGLKALDARVIERLRGLMAQTLTDRMANLEHEEWVFKEAERERELEDLYERVGRPMWSQLEHDGFTQRGISYPKRGVTAPNRAR